MTARVAHFTFETAHLHGAALPDCMRFRHRLFVQGMGYNVPTHNGLEFDEYDTPRAHYMLARDKAGTAVGCARLIPTSVPYMLESVLFRRFLDGYGPRERAWELSRFGATTPDVAMQLFRGLADHAEEYRASEYVFLTYTRMARVFSRVAGIPFTQLGSEDELGAFVVGVTPARIAQIRAR